MSTLDRFVGRELGTSDRLLIDQPLIDQFATCTGDRQWIHVDVERARRESPLGATIAHGYLILSLLARFTFSSGSCRATRAKPSTMALSGSVSRHQ